MQCLAMFGIAWRGLLALQRVLGGCDFSPRRPVRLSFHPVAAKKNTRLLLQHATGHVSLLMARLSWQLGFTQGERLPIRGPFLCAHPFLERMHVAPPRLRILSFDG